MPYEGDMLDKMKEKIDRLSEQFRDISDEAIRLSSQATYLERELLSMKDMLAEEIVKSKVEASTRSHIKNTALLTVHEIQLLDANEKIKAIKSVRERLYLGLMEAKQVVDHFEDQRNIARLIKTDCTGGGGSSTTGAGAGIRSN